MKKILILVPVLAIVVGAYAYYQSQQRPTDSYVATDVTTSDISTESGTSMAGGELATGKIDMLYVVQGSVFGWKATKAGWFHTGTIAVSNGSLSVSNNAITTGDFTVDMSSIKLLDITDPKFEWEIRDAFFEAPKYPTTTFIITTIKSEGTGSMVYGNLTIKDKTNAISFPAQITSSWDTMNVKASFSIDRSLRGLTMWNGMVNNYLEFNLDLSFSKSV